MCQRTDALCNHSPPSLELFPLHTSFQIWTFRCALLPFVKAAVDVDFALSLFLYRSSSEVSHYQYQITRLAFFWSFDIWIVVGMVVYIPLGRVMHAL